MTMHEIRRSPSAAWAGPLLIFAAFQGLSSLVKSETVAAPWYQAHPEQWVYPLQTVAMLAGMAFWWKQYTFRPLHGRIIAAAVLTGIFGIVLWILPSWLYDRGLVPDAGWLKSLGFTSRYGDGFDPTIWRDQPAVYAAAVAFRLLRMTVAVALAEELFWRGFLWRSVSDPYQDFSVVPFGQKCWKALAATVALFCVAHLGTDWFVAIIWCLLVSGLYIRTKSVGACVIAHAVSNLILGVYILKTGQWGFW